MTKSTFHPHPYPADLPMRVQVKESTKLYLCIVDLEEKGLEYDISAHNQDGEELGYYILFVNQAGHKFLTDAGRIRPL